MHVCRAGGRGGGRVSDMSGEGGRTGLFRGVEETSLAGAWDGGKE